jgi:DNA-binding GntR family transcriptional regulator
MARRSEPRPTLNLRPHAQHRHLNGNRTEGVYDALKEAILSCQLPGGTPLIESQLAAEFSVSKTPVREALLRLSKAGLVDLENIRGASVHQFTPDEIRDVFEMRLHLEPLALERSALHLGELELKALDQLLNDAEKAIRRSDRIALSKLNIAFHRGLCQCASNQLLLQWLDDLSDRRRMFSVRGWQYHNRSAQELREHRAILAAVRRRNVPLAQERLIAHIQAFSKLIETALFKEM